MVNPWLAMAAGADPAEHTRSVRRAHEAFLSGGTVTPPVRRVVAESWRRSADAQAARRHRAHRAGRAPPCAAYRDAHPLARAMPLFRELLGSIADDGAHLMAVCDAQGRLLWVEGHPGMRRSAERMNFVPGARWDEAARRHQRARHRARRRPRRADLRRPSTSAAPCSAGPAPPRPDPRPAHRAAARRHRHHRRRPPGQPAQPGPGAGHRAGRRGLSRRRSPGRRGSGRWSAALGARRGAAGRAAASGCGSAAGTARSWCCSPVTPRG